MERRVGTCSRRPALEIPPGSKSRGMRGEGRRGTWEFPSAPSRDGTAKTSASEVGAGQQDVGAHHSSDKSGEPSRGTPVEPRRAPGHGTVRGKDGRYIGLTAHLNATRTDSRAGAATSRTAAHDAGSSHRPGVDAR